MTIPFGLTRWDFFYANTGDPCRHTRRALGNPRYRSRAPFFATEVSSNDIQFNPTQATMDAEIAFAKDNNVSYWAFLLYNTSNSDYDSTHIAYNLYQASANKNDVKWCEMRPSYLCGGTGNYSTQVTEMVAHVQTSNYQLVLTNRPLVYIYYTAADLTTYWAGSYANFKAMLDSFRTAAQAAGTGNPYIVAMVSGATAGATVKTGLGADAISDYITVYPSGVDGTYASLASATEAYWEAQRVAATTVVPNVMSGWSRAPRIERPAPWTIATQRPWIGASTPFALPTNVELAAHVQEAVDFATTNSCAAILGYAWNEFDEGGWFCPTIGDPTGSRLVAIKNIIA